VEDLWLASAFQRDLQGLPAKLRIKAVRELPAEYIPGEKISNRHQVKETFQHRDVGNIGGLHLILPLILVLSLLAPDEQLAGCIEQLPLPLAHLNRVAPQGALYGAIPMAWSAAISWIILRPLIAPIQGRCPASEVNDGAVQNSQTTSIPATCSRVSRKPPSQPIPLGRFLMQQPPALAAFVKAHQGALIGAVIESDAPADPALVHIVKNLDLSHGHNGGGPGPEAAACKCWPGSDAVGLTRKPTPAAANSKFLWMLSDRGEDIGTGI